MIKNLEAEIKAAISRHVRGHSIEVEFLPGGLFMLQSEEVSSNLSSEIAENLDPFGCSLSRTLVQAIQMESLAAEYNLGSFCPGCRKSSIYVYLLYSLFGVNRFYGYIND